MHELRQDKEFLLEVLTVNPAAWRFLPADLRREPAFAAFQPVEVEPCSSPVDPWKELVGRWRYSDDTGEEEDFVVEFLEAVGSVRFLFEGQPTAAQCTCHLAQSGLRMEERQGDTVNIYEGCLEDGCIRGSLWCESSGQGNSFQEGASGNFLLRPVQTSADLPRGGDCTAEREATE
ncbi:unnamed protein product [Effrenium voratum]|nr:unnamed protein product [Effrenium voratum]